MIEAVWEGSDADFVIEALASLGRQIEGYPGPEIAVVSVYCDESGKLADSKVVVFAAAVADDSDWKTLGKGWLKALRQARIRSLHTKEAMRRKGQFEGWVEADRDGLLEQLAKLANERIACNYSFEMDTAKFSALPQPDRKRLKDLPYCAFEGLIRAIAHEHQDRPNMRFQLVYDLSEEYSTECLKLFNPARVSSILSSSGFCRRRAGSRPSGGRHAGVLSSGGSASRGCRQLQAHRKAPAGNLQFRRAGGMWRDRLPGWIVTWCWSPHESANAVRSGHEIQAGDDRRPGGVRALP